MDVEMQREGLLEAKKLFGTFKKLAKVLGVRPQALNNWVNFRRQMPVRYAFKIIKLTKGKIPFSALTIYLHPDDRKLDQWLEIKSEGLN